MAYGVSDLFSYMLVCAVMYYNVFVNVTGIVFGLSIYTLSPHVKCQVIFCPHCCIVHAT